MGAVRGVLGVAEVHRRLVSAGGTVGQGVQGGSTRGTEECRRCGGSMRRAGAAVGSLWGDRRVQVYDRPGQAGDGHTGMQGERGWCQGQDERHALTRVCSSESPVSAAMRHSVVGSGCLFTLQKWYSRTSSCSSVGITGFSMAISSWGRAMGPGTAKRG